MVYFKLDFYFELKLRGQLVIEIASFTINQNKDGTGLYLLLCLKYFETF